MKKKKHRSDYRIIAIDNITLKPTFVFTDITSTFVYLEVSKNMVHQNINTFFPVAGYYLMWASDYEKDKNVVLPGAASTYLN